MKKLEASIIKWLLRFNSKPLVSLVSILVSVRRREPRGEGKKTRKVRTRKAKERTDQATSTRILAGNMLHL